MQALQRMLLLRQLQCKSSAHLHGYLQRLASTHKRRSTVLPTDQLEELKQTYFQTRTTLATDEWQQVRETLINNYKHINAGNVDAVILGVCNQPEQLPLAKDYIRYLNETGTQPNQATLGRLLRVYNAAYHERGGTATALSADEQRDILEICKRLRAKHELLDATTCENLIHGLVATPNWLEAKNMLEMMKITTNIASMSAYTELTVKAFSCDDKQLGWQLLEEMAVALKQPKCEIYLAYLKQITKIQDIEQLFHFLERHDLLITQQVAEAIVQMSAKWPEALCVQHTTLTRLGKCQSCAQQLQHVSISDEEFERLRSGFLDKVLIRKDIFQKSTPAEVTSFKRYIEETAPYDCVIDGLNVAYSTGAKKPPQELAKLLAAVVHHFRTRRKHVLVLGRKHMRSWSRDAMNYVHKHASVFLTNNLTHDDPFLLYATLKSGPTADFFSRDLMRAHAHLLGTELKSIFRRWQQEHQYSLVTQTDTGKIIVKEPIRHRLSAHKVADTWHIPCRAAYTINPVESFEVPEQWLCVRMKQSS